MIALPPQLCVQRSRFRRTPQRLNILQVKERWEELTDFNNPEQ
jgi:hypothetical protein